LKGQLVTLDLLVPFVVADKTSKKKKKGFSSRNVLAGRHVLVVVA
jgi:hypothetical protein